MAWVIAWLLAVFALVSEMKKTRQLQDLIESGGQGIDVSPPRLPRLAPPTRRQDCPPKLEA